MQQQATTGAQINGDPCLKTLTLMYAFQRTTNLSILEIFVFLLVIDLFIFQIQMKFSDPLELFSYL